MFSPETRHFFGKLTTAFLVIGTIVALMVMAILKGSEAMSKQSKPNAPTGTNSNPTNTPNDPPVTTVNLESQALQAIEDAMREPNAEQRRGLWSKASRLWSQIVSQGNPTELNREAVSAFLYAADELYKKGENQKAVEAVYEAQGFAHGDSEMEQRVEDWRIALGR